MDYYTQKKAAFIDIDTMISKGTSLPSIIFKISTKYGFSKKIVLDRIENHKQLNEEKEED